MRRAPGSQPLGIALALSLGLALAGPARAGDPEEKIRPSRRLQGREIIERVEQAQPEETGWFERHVSFIRGSGFQYSHDLSLADHELEFRVLGPVYKMMQSKRLGLMFEVRF